MQSGEENSSSVVKNSRHQTAFLNAPQSERIFPTTVENFASKIRI